MPSSFQPVFWSPWAVKRKRPYSLDNMIIHDIRLYYFRLPFAIPVTVGSVTLSQREGFVVRLADSDGNAGYGEISPLPGLDPFTLGDCRKNLREFSRRITSGGSNGVPAGSKFNPAVVFGLESAVFALETGKSRNRNKGFKEYQDIAVNGLFVPVEDREQAGLQADRLILDGFKTIKIKIGRLSLDAEELAIRYLVERGGGDIKLRLDGNRLMSIDRYERYYRRLRDLPVEYVEEPLENGDLGLAGEVGWNLAIDESLPLYWNRKHRAWSGLPDAVTHVVLKPNTPVGFASVMRWFSRSANLKILPVLSSAFNSIYGIAAMAMWADTVFAAKQSPHGLGTGSFLLSDLAADLPGVKNGLLSVPVHILWQPKPSETVYMRETAL
jgi:o-succinylbenzoate synthase